MDAQTGRVLYEKNADEQSLIASTTKIMTGLLVCEAGELEREISVPPEAAGVDTEDEPPPDVLPEDAGLLPQAARARQSAAASASAEIRYSRFMFVSPYSL